MTEFNIKLAEIPVNVKANFQYTKYFCNGYFTEDEPTVFVEVTREDIEKEREFSRLQNIKEGIDVINYPDEYLETTALYRKITDELIHYNILLFHGCVVAKDGKAYMFIAKSGTGKTTHTKLWLKNIKGSYILNGDKPLLLFKKSGVFACGTPWQGKEKFGVNEILPLCGICILERAAENTIKEISYKEAFNTLLVQSHHKGGARNTALSVNMISKLKSVGLYRLGCNTEDEAATVSYNGMRKDI